MSAPRRRYSHRRSLEVRLLFATRDAQRDEEAAYRAFVVGGDRRPETMSQLMSDYENKCLRVRRIRTMRRCVSLLSIRQTRHRLSLVELRHGVDAYTLRKSELLNEWLSSDIAPSALDELIAELDRAPGDHSHDDLDTESTTSARGANAPPHSCRRTLTTTRGAPS